MTYDLLLEQISYTTKLFNLYICQVLLFAVGVSLSCFYGYFFLPFVSDYESLFFYIIGMVVPLLPSMLNMEGVKL